MVHGSGPNDMDGSLGPNKPLKDLAYGLAAKGIASIRYNKRSFDYQRSLQSKINEVDINLEVVDDAVLALQLGKKLGYRKVILIGHSLGGHMSPKIASIEKVDGVISLAGNSSALVDVIGPQLEYLMKNDSTSGITQFQINIIKQQCETVRSKKFDESTIGYNLPFGLSGVYWKSLENYSPVKLAKKQDCPYLILNGDRDYQVTQEQAKNWNNGNKNILSKTIIYPGLNHLFFSGEGLCLPAEYMNEQHVSSQVISDISDWIHRL